MQQNLRIHTQIVRCIRGVVFLLLLLLPAACGDSGSETAVTAVPLTPTTDPASLIPATPVPSDFIVVATDAPNPPFTEFDDFGNVSGFIERIMAEIASAGSLAYEFVVTPHEGVLDSIAAGSNRDFDAVMSNLVIPATVETGIAYTNPYLEVGQVMVVLVDENRIVNPTDIQGDMMVGVTNNSYGEETAREVLGLTADNLDAQYSSSIEALQALINERITAVIIESYTAEYYAQTYPDRLKIVGGAGPNAWISNRQYGIAVAADNTFLLDRLNTAIDAIEDKGALARLTVELIPPDPLDPGESRAGTPADELHIGMLGQITDMDPAGSSDFISWELKNNTMSGLYSYNGSSQLIPLLATNLPVISEDGLEYTVSLRQGLRFADGSELTADDVKWAVDRARSLGNFLVNDYLKDSDEDNFADDDAVQVMDQYTVKFVLQTPTSHFLSILATPPYFPISNECYILTWDLENDCGGIGPYTIVDWQIGDRMVLQANPEWPGTPGPAFENIVVRFYDELGAIRNSLEKFQSIDMVWTGFPYEQLIELSQADANGDGLADYRIWEGASTFKSYLIFDQDTESWNRKKVRQAAALAVDRSALAALFAGERSPLFSPVPDSMPGHVAVLPQRNLPQARSLLLEEGYSPAVPLAVELWYVNNGRYSSIEDSYANAIKAQLEETGVFQVTLQGIDFETFRGQIGICGYSAYLIGWPTPGRPVNYLDISSWTDFFIENTDSGFCSNYESSAMTAFLEAVREETNSDERAAIFAAMQTLWADELPTLDLLQEQRFAISLTNIDNVQVDALGLLHYETLTKGGS